MHFLFIPGKKNLIFLDQLIEAVEDGSFPFSEQDMRDEVATFMFEVHMINFTDQKQIFKKI